MNNVRHNINNKGSMETIHKRVPISTRVREKEKKGLRLGIGALNDELPSGSSMSGGFKKTYRPTINATPSIFIHAGNDVPSYVSDCSWLQDCYYTSLGISQTVSEECVSSESESEAYEEETQDNIPVNDLLTNVTSMVSHRSEKIPDDTKQDIIQCRSWPSRASCHDPSKDGQLSPGQSPENFRWHFFSEPELYLHPINLRENGSQRAPALTASNEPLVLPQIDVQKSSNVRSPRDTTAHIKPFILKSHMKNAWGSAELPIQEFANQFHEGPNSSMIPSITLSRSSNEWKSALNLDTGSNMRNQLSNVKTMSSKYSNVHHSDKKNECSGYSEKEKLWDNYFKYRSDSRLAASKNWNTVELSKCTLKGSDPSGCCSFRGLHVSATEDLGYLSMSDYDLPAELNRCVSTPTIRPPSGRCPERRFQRPGAIHQKPIYP